MLRIAMIVIAVAAIAAVSVWLFAEYYGNPRVARELIEHPDGERAQKVMLLTLPSGRRIPVNYLRKEDRVYAGADGRWWRELVGNGADVQLLVRGETWTGHGRAITDDPARRETIFRELRPNALKGFGTLVEIELRQRMDVPPPR